MRVMLLTAAALLAAPALSFAQSYDRSGGTQAFVNMCIARAQGTGTTQPEPTCACGAGVLSGRMNDRQYDIMRQLAPLTGNQTAMNSAVQAMLRQGYSTQEISQVGQMLIDLGPHIATTCGVLER